MLIAVQIFFGTELALSVTFGDTSPKGRGFAPCFLIYTSISSPSSSEYIPL